MSEEILPNEDKETLRRKLEQLKQEYERTAQRLQRAEHHDAIRRHTVSDQNRLTQIDSSQMLEPSSATSSMSTSEYGISLSETHTNINDRNNSGFSAVEKLQLSEITSTPPLNSPACKRSPAHRLRSKRSRLRLQNKERESDTDISQERENTKRRESSECPINKEKSLKDDGKEKERDTEKKSKDRPIRVRTDSKIEKPPQELENDGKREEHGVLNCSTSQSNNKLPVIVGVENNIENQNADCSLTDRPIKEELQSGTPVSTHASYLCLPSDKSEETLKETKQSPTDFKKGYDGIKHSSGVLDSCTLVEGLPFPVEYYIRTTRRMAASNSTIDLDAVIYSQLTRGRVRRRLSQSQTSSRSQVTPERSEPVCKSTSQPRGRGRRGRRGRRRTTVGRTSSANPGSVSQADSQIKSKSHTESPRQSELAIEGPQVESQSNNSHGPPNPEQGVTQDLKHLPDSQLYLDSHLLPDSNVYPIFRRKLGQTERESQTGTNKNDRSPFLPSLASLIQALQEKETKNGQLTAADIQDFQLPDEDFGQLMLERLHWTTSNVEPFTERPLVYKTRQSSRRKSNIEAHCSGEIFNPETLTTSSLEDSLPICQPDITNQSQTEIQKDAVNALKNKSSSLMEIKTGPDGCINNEGKVLSKNTSLSPVILELSPSLSAHTQKGQDPILPSLGMSPHFLTPGSPLDLRVPLFSSSAILKSPPSVTLMGCVSPDSVSAKTSGNMKNCTSIKHADVRRGSGTSSKISQEAMTKADNAKLDTSSQNNTALVHGCLNSPESQKRESSCILENVSSLDVENKIRCTPENPKLESFNTETSAELNPEMEVQICKTTKLCSETQSNAMIYQTSIEKTFLDTKKRNQSEEFSCNSQILNEETLTATSVLQEMHTFKALDGGCVLDLCLVRWPSEDWCICVAGEWSVCLWAQMKGDQKWSLLHTWTFAQSVMSLQAIPDSPGLLCVALGHLEITETRVICCPSMDGPFSQTVVCKDTIQAVVGVSNCRLVCCSTPGDKQRVSVLALSQEGSVEKTLPLVSAKQNIRTLAVVEGEKEALIGWTECKTLLIWNMKSGQLLQTIYLEKSLPMTNYMKGYSYRGVLCVLLQNSGNVCDDESNTCLFTVIATNPLTGKHFTLTSINDPDQPKQQLIDSDVSGNRLVGVFQSGRLTVWDLRESVAKAGVVLDELCRLARWAGPDTLLTGYLNGDVCVFHYK